MITRMQKDNTNEGTAFLFGLLAGLAIGAGVALYFGAPRLLSEVRDRLSGAATGVKDAASERAQAVASGVADVVDRVADVADDVTRETQAARDDIADAVAQSAHVVSRGAKAVEHFAKTSKIDRQS